MKEITTILYEACHRSIGELSLRTSEWETNSRYFIASFDGRQGDVSLSL